MGQMKVFVAGATGAMGKRLVPALLAAGHQVVAMTRSADKAAALAAAGAEPMARPSGNWSGSPGTRAGATASVMDWGDHRRHAYRVGRDAIS
jgi:nucleoside-diphosphate-sugar epimerase